MTYYVYIMSNFTRTVFYTGMTNDLNSRVWEHKKGLSKFTSKFHCSKLLYFEEYEYIRDAINRENQLKRWLWEWKRALILIKNPQMNDLAANWFEEFRDKKQID